MVDGLRVVKCDPVRAQRAADRLGIGLDCEAALNRAGCHAGRPFIVADDGYWPPDFNAFLCALPGFGVRSPASAVTYAYNLLAVNDFAQARNQTVWELDGPAFRQLVSARQSGPGAVGTSALIGTLAAGDKLFQWGVEAGYADGNPLPRKRRWVRRLGGPAEPVESMELSPRSPGPAPVQFLSVDQYQRFLSALSLTSRGCRPRRTPDRDSAYAQLTVSTGLRRAESGLLLTCEIPVDGSGTPADCWLARGSAKYRSGRMFQVHAPAARDVHKYWTLERAVAVERGTRSGRYDGAGWRRVTAVTGSGSSLVLRVDGKNVRADTLAPVDRMRLLDVTGENPEPMMVWLTESGMPMHPECWTGVFARVSDRAFIDAPYGSRVRVTPHVLRHTFATHMLSMLIASNVAAARAMSEPNVDLEVLQLRLFEPVGQLKRMLGHRSAETTWRYVHLLREVGDVVRETLADWSEAVDL